MITQVYWIRAAHHTDITTQGYVGVSRNVNVRWNSGHKWAHANKKHTNTHFANAISKYGWESLVKSVVVIADESYCYDLEKKLRPCENIGWNIATGGGSPPKWNGRKHSVNHVLKRMESRRLTRIAKGQIKQMVVNGVKYESSKIASIAVGVPEVTLRHWAYGKGVPSKKYEYIFECRYTR